jgi:hypothetical protein
MFVASPHSNPARTARKVECPLLLFHCLISKEHISNIYPKMICTDIDP